MLSQTLIGCEFERQLGWGGLRERQKDRARERVRNKKLEEGE